MIQRVGIGDEPSGPSGLDGGRSEAALRRLPQPLHLLEFVFRSQHYHFGLFERPDEGLRSAQDRMSRLAARSVGTAATVLDIGCGLGGTSRLLSQAGAEVTAIDLCEASVEFADHGDRAQLDATRVRFEVCTLAAFAARTSARFDAAIAIEVLQHFPSLDSFFAQCNGLLDTAGRLVIHDVCIDVEVDWARVPFHRRGEIVQRAAAGNFELEAHTDRTAEVAPTLSRILDGLVAGRAATIEFFESGSRDWHRPVQADLDQLMGYVGEVRRAFANRDLGYETMTFRRRP